MKQTMRVGMLAALLLGSLSLTSCGIVAESLVETLVEPSIQDGVSKLQKGEKGSRGSHPSDKQREKEAAQLKAQGKCPDCRGMGKTPDGQYTCLTCKGTGKYQETKSEP